MHIAIVGTGVAGLTCAHLLHGIHDVTVFEAQDRPGGHANTVRVDLPDGPVDVDTGFLVYNERTYPLLIRLFERLGVETGPSDMSFSVSDETAGLEWRGTSPNTVFAQRRNLVRPGFLRMLRDVARFNRLATSSLDEPPDDDVSLADLLARRAWSDEFLHWYLLPLGSAIWSADPATFTGIPARTFAEFFSRHGLLGLGHQPPWRTVPGGSARYVRAVLNPLQAEGRVRMSSPVQKIRRVGGTVELVSAAGPELFDHVILATHSDEALELLGDPTTAEREVLGSIPYQDNRATLHTDAGLLPSNRRAWASWNYHRFADAPERATLTYDINRLQGLATTTPVLVTLNRDDAIDPAAVLQRFDYSHPVFDTRGVANQRRQLELSAHQTSFCGAYWGYGFHEDGVRSATAICARLGARL